MFVGTVPPTAVCASALLSAVKVCQKVSPDKLFGRSFLSICTFAAHPGETTPVHSLETKALMQNKGPKIVVGLGMDALGYILSPNFSDPAKPLKYMYRKSRKSNIRGFCSEKENIADKFAKSTFFDLLSANFSKQIC